MPFELSDGYLHPEYPVHPLARDWNAGKIVENHLSRGVSNVTTGHQLFSLDGRIALVTGASRGLGLAMAEGLAEAGAIVALNGRNADALDGVASALRGRGLKAEIAPFDVTDQHAVKNAIETIITRHGRLDILVANAGINHRVPLADWTPADLGSASNYEP
jgi:gluconate 5-dehydrogenase